MQEWRSGDDGFSQPKKLNNNKEETISLKDLDILEKHITEQIEQTNNEEKHKLQEFFQKIRSKILENQDKIDKIICTKPSTLYIFQTNLRGKSFINF